MHYLTSALREDHVETDRPRIDGAVLQAQWVAARALPLIGAPSELARAQESQTQIESRKVLSDVSQFFRVSICVRRWVSFMAWEGQDDCFSSDLNSAILEKIFAVVRKTCVLLLVRYSGADEYVSSNVDKLAILKWWADAISAGGEMTDAESEWL